MFDGEVTRVFDQKIIGNIIAGRKNDSNVVRPHMLLMRTSLETIRLSTYLQGHVALVADPDINWDPAHTIDVSYQGDDEFLDLKCHKLWVTTSVPREKGRTLPYVRFELWLAERRNYIPVRALVFAFRFSKTLPYKESSVSEFREIEPGIWFPFAARHLGYNDFPLREGRQEPHGRYTYEVRSVSLNPTYEKSFFRDLTFPPNTSVYEVEDGKIVKSYLTGEGTKSAWGWWILLINIAVIVAFLAVLVLRRHRKRRGAVA